MRNVIFAFVLLMINFGLKKVLCMRMVGKSCATEHYKFALGICSSRNSIISPHYSSLGYVVVVIVYPVMTLAWDM